MLFISWGGKQYSCNPRAIYEYIVRNYPDDYKVVWAEDKTMNLPVAYYSNIEILKVGTYSYYRALRESKYVIFNCRMTGNAYLNKRNGQIYIQTWHGTAIKKLGFDSNIISKKVVRIIKNEMNNIDAILSGSRHMTKVFRQAYRYKGEILEIGTPRNDQFFYCNQTANNKIKSAIGVPETKSIILYAPTFRDNSDMSCYSITAEKVIECTKKRFPEKDWIFCFRLHPKMKNVKEQLTLKVNDDTIYDLTDYPNMEELLLSVDILITDYSSSILDFALSNKPSFVYATDINTYDRGVYIDVKDLPFPMAENEVTLYKNILEFDENNYCKNIKKYLEDVLGSFETGNASQKLLEWMNEA